MKRTDNSSGQTIVALLVFMMLAITLTLTAAMVVIVNTQSDTTDQQGEQALENAQSGVENALLRLERDDTYTGETLSLANGTATITVSGTGPLTIVSIGHIGHVARTMTATAAVSGDVVTVTNWSETP